MDAWGGTGGRRPAYITQLPPQGPTGSRRPDNGLHLFFDEVPGAHVFGLFLHPEQLGGIGIAAQDICQSLQRERIKLLQTNNGYVGAPQLFPLVHQVVIHLPGAQKDAANLASDELRISNHLLESSRREVFQTRRRLGIAQQELRREDYERLTYAAAILATIHLSPQQVEVLRRIRAVCNLHVIFSTQLKKPFNTSTGVLRTLAFKPVRQEAEPGRSADSIWLQRKRRTDR